MSEPDELGEDLWPTLYALVCRQGPRILQEWGYCGSCYLPPSGAREFGGSLWCWCSTCRVRWVVTDTLDGLLELDPPDPADERAFLDLQILASCQELPPISAVEFATGETVKKGTNTTIGIDPWTGAARQHTDTGDSLSPPDHWLDLPPIVRRRIGAALMTALAEHPGATRRDAARLAHIVWSAVRPDPDVHESLVQPELANPVFFLSHALTRLLGVGDVLHSLRARRADLDAQINRLEALRGEVVER